MKAFVGFAGFGGVDIALHKFGFDVTGVEIDDTIAQVARDNGHDTFTADILDVDPRNYSGWDLMHFSPPCPNFSIANQKSSETEYDIKLAEKIVQFVTIAQPRFFTLENVYQYRKSESWKIILEALYSNGYMVDVAHLNAADYGVPQTRKRMIVRAVRGGFVPYMPPAVNWTGWYEAIEDLLPSLPDSQFADWQLMRMPKELRTMLCMTGNTNGGSLPRALLLGNGQRSTPKAKDQPADTITSNSNQTGIRAALISGQNSSTARFLTKTEPSTTVTALHKGFPRAFVLDGTRNAFDKLNETITVRYAHEPIFTIRASVNKKIPRGFVDNRRVVSMTPRALARFQSFPDRYKLPDHNGLACKGIGNAVPPKMYEAVLESLGLGRRILEAEATAGGVR